MFNMAKLLDNISKSLAVSLLLTVKLAELCSRQLIKPATGIKVIQETFTFDGIASSASAYELTKYMEYLSFIALDSISVDPNLIRTPAGAIMYTSENYTGHNITFNEIDYAKRRKACATLPEDFQGGVKSIKISNNSCVRLYTEKYCRGPQRIYTRYSYNHQNLSSFGEQVRSISSCKVLSFLQ